MGDTLSALALLKVNWDYSKRDHLDNFVPHIATIISRRHFSNVDAEKLCRAFESEWGMRIPHYVMVSLLTRAAVVGLVRKSDLGGFAPVPERVAELDYSAVAPHVQAKISDLQNSIVRFTEERFGRAMTPEDAENWLRLGASLGASADRK